MNSQQCDSSCFRRRESPSVSFHLYLVSPGIEVLEYKMPLLKPGRTYLLKRVSIMTLIFRMFTPGSLIGASASSPLSNEGQSSETQNSNVTITTRTSNPVYNSESRSEHPTQISAPRPDITIKTEPDPDEVTYGESFNITVEVTNQKRRENISEPAGPPR